MDRKNDKEFCQGAGQHIFTPRRLIISFISRCFSVVYLAFVVVATNRPAS